MQVICLVLMNRIVDFLMDNISNLTSARNIADALTGNKDKINHKTVGNYMQYLCNAFAFYRVRRYDICLLYTSPSPRDCS